MTFTHWVVIIPCILFALFALFTGGEYSEVLWPLIAAGWCHLHAIK